MARIPDHELTRLKTGISLVRLVEASGVALKQHGKDYLGRCPLLVVSKLVLAPFLKQNIEQ